MNQSEDNFETLRQLLRLKCYETPPPGYFNRFTDQVMAQIRAGEAGARSAVFSRSSEEPWYLKILQLFEFKPAFAGAFASALALLLVAGIVFADRPDTLTQPMLQNSSQPSGAFAAATPLSLPPLGENTGIIASTNPAASLQPVASLFSSPSPLAEQVSFSLPGN